VLSEVAFDLFHPDRTMAWITSSCGQHSSRKGVNVGHMIGYSQAQLEHDIEEARWEFAQQLAGKAAVRALLPAALQVVGGVPRVSNSKVHSSPASR